MRQLARRTMATLIPRCLFLVSGPGQSGQVCLTFDDGPHPQWTPPLLDVLARLQVKATFFLIGREAKLYPEIVRRIVADGHAVGNHTWSHQHPHSLSPREFVHEVRQTNAIIAELVGKTPRLFRPPHGKVTPRQAFSAWCGRQTIALWNNDPKDFSRRSADELAEVFRQRPPQSGDIVLLHDNHPHAAAVLDDVVTEARGRNLVFVTPGVWLPHAN